MGVKDVAKAAGVGLLALVIDFAIATATVLVWSFLIDPGHDQAYYTAGAPAIATVSTRIAGPVILGLLVLLFSRRRPDRNPFLFALIVWIFYALFDGASVLFQHFFSVTIAITMALKLAGALIGAALARAMLRPAQP